MKKYFKIAGIMLVVLLCLVVIYAIYFFTSSNRIEDNLPLEIHNNKSELLKLDKEYSIVTYNIGFGAYSPDFSFFMDGGTESVAKSAEEVIKNTNGAVEDISLWDADFIFFQEVDIKADRSHDVNMEEILASQYTDYGYHLAINYDSPYILYPFLEPHGKSLAGMMTLSKYQMEEAERISLPITESLTKVLDLDRCYSVTEVPVETGEKLYLYQTHLTAYGGGPEIAEAQIKKMFADMGEKLDEGAYVICAGDFNHDLLGNSVALLNESLPEGFSWASPMRYELVDERFTYVEAGMTPTVRDCAEPYEKGTTIVAIIDGFFVSPNVSVTYAENLDADFAHSDHNPIVLKFTLEP